MKKLLILLLTLVLILPFSVFAEEETVYNSVNISAVFVTNADVSSIDRIQVYYRYSLGDREVDDQIVLLRSNNFTATIQTNDVTEARFIYGYCITKDDLIDKAGFLPITAETKYDNNKGLIRIILSVDFNSMKFDGKKYRANSDASNNDILARKKGEINTIEDISGTPTETNTTTTTTTRPVETTTTDSVVIGNTTTTTTTVLVEKDKKDEKTVEKKESKSLKLLIIVGIIVAGAVVLFIFYTMIKIAQANKRV